ncbi:MAG: hypothetical protein E7260_07165 [Lachnospiraceae bacterium]|nr:hypothetical protein [Lachnospiraceae bacterium]
MMHWKRRAMALLLAVTLAFGGCGGGGQNDTTPTPEPTKEAETPVGPETPEVTGPVVKNNKNDFRDLTAGEIVEEMGTGWNLGNTMDGHTGFTPMETLWQPYETTKELMTAVHDAGFNTVRIPVTWGNMIDDDNGYVINEQWLTRVQEIVDYCVSQDMYAIINIHHDGAEQTGWLRIASEDMAPVKEKFAAVWKQIAERFKEYDEHLVFESMNEVTGDDNSAAGITKDMQVIMELNQLFVNTVRATGGNNAKRWLSVPARYTNITNTCKKEFGFKMPTDAAGRLFLAVHEYDWTFGLLENMGSTTWSLQSSQALEIHFEELKDFLSAGYPVILGEYGAVDKNNTAERAYHLEVVNYICEKLGIVPCLWDAGAFDHINKEVDYCFTVINREDYTQLFPELVSGIMRGTFLDYTKLEDIVKNPTVTSLTGIKVSEEKLSLAIGDYVTLTAEKTPAEANDLVLWKTSNDAVATVYNGMVHAKGMGTAVITAYSMSGSTTVEIPVAVGGLTSEVPCTKIAVPATTVNVPENGHLNLSATVEPENSDAFLTYESTNTSVCTVNEHGEVYGHVPGIAYVIITSSTGLTRSIKIKVFEVASTGELELALNAYFSDSKNNYFGNDVGARITVNGEGQYTVVIDAETDLSDAARAAGVTSFAGMGSLYIKDYLVTSGKKPNSGLASCDIMFDKVVVDGEELVITQTAPKTAIKASTLDTGDPMNAWDGSSVAGVTANSDFTLSIDGHPEPKRIEVTFTLSNIAFQTTETAEVIEMTKITPSEKTSTMKVGETKEFTINMEPLNVTENIAFMSEDSSVAVVDCTAVAPENGVVTVKVTALQPGQVVITAMGEVKGKTRITITVE